MKHLGSAQESNEYPGFSSGEKGLIWVQLKGEMKHLGSAQERNEYPGFSAGEKGLI